MRWREIVGGMAAEAVEPSVKPRRRDRGRERELLLGRHQPGMAITAGKAMATVRTVARVPAPPMGRPCRDLPAGCPLADGPSGGFPSADAIIGRSAERSGTSGG